MSYILDALRRADAERERGAVPSLQSQQHTIVDDDAVATRSRSLLWAVIALAVALVAVLAWMLFGAATPAARAPIEGSITAPVPAPLPTLQPAPAAPTATAAPAPAPTATATALPTAPITAAPTPATSPAPALRPASPAPTPAVAVAPPATRDGADARRASPPPAPKRVATTAPTGPGTAPAAAEPRVYAQSELPEEIRRDLPKIVVGGSSYSSAAASRMVMINGQVFHEGDRLAPDLVLERIRQKSAVLAFKGWRYELVF